MPKAKRTGIYYYGEKTPDYYYYPQREKSPAYVIGRKLRLTSKI